jgi:hypothetical protein
MNLESFTAGGRVFIFIGVMYKPSMVSNSRANDLTFRLTFHGNQIPIKHFNIKYLC